MTMAMMTVMMMIDHQVDSALAEYEEVCSEAAGAGVDLVSKVMMMMVLGMMMVMGIVMMMVMVIVMMMVMGIVMIMMISSWSEYAAP